ncbi:hypothetical protein BpHYR1_018116 [Brachionus plicatilis]|uniref:Uncharacterized protein n=1 Tax=Brachionus plicatilis TaxID=10195 RepID=A0A3M7QKP8_BRAPC|nr:hypothetical protein BpHYR1_018116 [Brachionus plicatilis]
MSVRCFVQKLWSKNSYYYLNFRWVKKKLHLYIPSPFRPIFIQNNKLWHFCSKLNLPSLTKYGLVSPYFVIPIQTITEIGFFITPKIPYYIKMKNIPIV